MKKVTILGIACCDMIVKPVETIPTPGQLKLVNSIEMFTGGCAVNTAIDLAKIGITPTIVTPIGTDTFGEFIMKELNRQGIETKYVMEMEAVGTSSSIVLVKEDGERSFLHTTGANGLFTIDDINFEAIDISEILFVAGSLIMKTFDGDQTVRTLVYAKEHGKYTVLDTAWDTTNRWGETIIPSLPYIDLFVPSFDEAKMITGIDNEKEMVKFFKQNGAKDVIIKLGSQGAYADVNGENFYVKPYLVNPIDTTGAGDSFMAGILTGLSLNWDIKKTIKFANAVGAYCVSSIGASSGIKSLNEIEKFIKDRDELNEA